MPMSVSCIVKRNETKVSEIRRLPLFSHIDVKVGYSENIKKRKTVIADYTSSTS